MKENSAKMLALYYATDITKHYSDLAVPIN